MLYHGSEKIIERSAYGKGAYANDFGRGFYLTRSDQMAAEWACGLKRDGFVNRYELDCDGLRILNLNSGKYTILNWLAVLARYRSYWQRASIAERAKAYLQEHFFVPVEKYDVIIGYRADDSYFSFAQDFITNAISYRKLCAAMRLGELGEQIVIKSKRAFSRLSFVDYQKVEAEEYYERRNRRDREARQAYRRLQHEPESEADLFMMDIMRGEMTNEDPRLQ